MADSTLSLTYDHLLEKACWLIYGKASDDVTDAEKAKADEAVNDGYRQFLYPPAVGDIAEGYEWGFLRPTTTLTTTADEEDQDLPDDFDSLIDGFTYEAGAQMPTVHADVGEGTIRRLREQSDESGYPRVAAIRWKSSDLSEGQRQEVMWYPTPDDEYTFSYRYQALVDKLTTGKYPLGAMKHAETLRLSVLAAAEAQMNDEYGKHWENFLHALKSSIKRDNRQGVKQFGNVGTHGEYESGSRVGLRNYTLTVGDEVIEG